MISRAYTTCRYGQMHYRIAGTAGECAPVVLLHQNPSSSFEYEPLIAALAADRLVVAFDTPGYGMSDAPPASPGMAGYAAAFSDALDALEVEGVLAGQVDLYGFHTGSLLACELAIARPDRVRAVSLTGIPMYDADALASRLADAENYPALDEEGTVVRDLTAGLWAYVVGKRDPRVPLEKAALNFADKARAMDRFTWAYRGVWSWDFARLEQVAQPALLLQPAEDLMHLSLKAAARLPSCRVVELTDLDRDIFDIAPERIADELRDFLDCL
ncbi:alpha/beta fold hydrolase [Novosphingobium guangzhouense]|uniref:Alpha/beta hydrolase n=1 Tax=Novosphingobium guangzhouense TaxID=1850347 RepID=A0A2K2G740_9SPHN|nr:alpha/beta fold hydrolase [Novosphingobium guangzhouense]PNU06842.1 alpha/beta hydrolase [Novosphingobium guangzhouense]